MVADSNGKHTGEMQEESGKTRVENGFETKDQVSLHVQSSQKGLLDEKKRRGKFKKFDPSPSAKFRRIAEERNEISRSVPSAEQMSIGHCNVPFVKKIDWASLREMCKQWIRDPMNMALFAWILCVTISGSILFLVMTGMLNGAIPKKSQRETWFEVNNQILNALFTLMCLYQHPKRFYHLVLLCRWRPDDVLRLRKIYCKNGTYKPNEWVHMMVVVLLLHLNCFAQYALCGLNLGYPRSKRPALGVGLCISVAIAAPAIASVYNILSPLGKEYETEIDQEAQVEVTCVEVGKSTNLRLKSLEKRYSFMVRDDSVTDCFQWLCCCACSLAQEVRTGDYYDVVEDMFYVKQANDDTQLAISPLPREDGQALFTSSPSSPYVGKAKPAHHDSGQKDHQLLEDLQVGILHR